LRERPPLNPLNVLRVLLIGIVVLVLGAIGAGFLLPERVRVERTVDVARPPATVFTVLNGFRHFRAWSPWAALDPAMQITLEGPTTGVGARLHWSSAQRAVGSGSLEIVESLPYRRVGTRQTFSGTSREQRAHFELEPRPGAGTRVTWVVEADFGGNPLDRWFGLMLEGMVGPDIERGLARLKAHIETLPEADFAELPVETLQVEAMPIVFVSGQSSTDPAAIAQAYDRALQRLTETLAREGVEPSGPPLAIGRNWDAQARRYAFDVALPVPADTPSPRNDRDVRLGQTYAGLVLKSAHRGPHDGLATHLERLMAYKQATGFESNGAPWDVYVSNATTSGTDPVTETYVPVK
jgi:effector-binding domain-containing protein/carbon monoxide dehydrogenase subunit G